ncbi:MAG: C40 family peptidase [Chitinophagaceae bacterium]|nr:C40 family peptidase [Chitinophagaceae bacterium]
MRNTIAACLAIFIVVSSSCNTSEELLHPQSFRYTKRKGNIKFIDNVEIAANNQHKIKVLAGEKVAPNKPMVTSEMMSRYADMMGLLPEAVNNYMLYRFIDEWYGVKYCYGGTDKEGIDCSAFVQRLYEEVFCTDLVRTAREQFHNCKIVWDKTNLSEGDLVFFRTRGRRISHVGIYLTNNFFVHASSSSGVMISNLAEAYWSRRYAGAGKVPKGNAKPEML